MAGSSRAGRVDGRNNDDRSELWAFQVGRLLVFSSRGPSLETSFLGRALGSQGLRELSKAHVKNVAQRVVCLAKAALVRCSAQEPPAGQMLIDVTCSLQHTKR